jgi:Xaa-Pro aminopeptidase
MNLPSLSAQEFERRRLAVQQRMQAEGLDLLVAYGDDHAIFGPAHVRYLTNFPVHFEPACVLVPAKGAPVLVTGPETADHAVLTVAPMRILAIEEFGVPGEEYPFITMDKLGHVVQELLGTSPRRVGVAGLNQISVDTWERVRQALGNAEIERSDDLLLKLRKVKSPEEIEVLKHAYHLTQLGMEAALTACRVGAYEFEVAAAAEYAMRRAGAEGLAIDTIVASGIDNSRPIVGRAGRRQLRAGEHVSLTVAPRYEGYNAPIGRVVHLGEPPDFLRKAAEAALEAQRRCVAALRPGAVCSAVDAAARSYLEEQGYGKYCAYGVVHSVGVQEFEPPFFGPSTTDIVESPMVVSVDIPLFFGPWGGFRLEDSFVVRDAGNEALTSIQPGLIVLPV